MIPLKLATLFAFIAYLQSSYGCELKAINANTEEVCFNIPVITTYRNKTYYFEDNKQVNWYNAYLACKQYNMELISIDSDAEFDYISKFINSVTTTNKVSIWTSGNDLGTEGEYKWMNNGRKILSKRWHKGQPDNAGGIENCVNFWHYTNKYLLNDSNCNYNLTFICQSIDNSCCRS